LGPGPFGARATLTLSPDLLRRLGRADAADVLAAPVTATVAIDGTVADLSGRAAIGTPGGVLTITGRRQHDAATIRVETAALDLGRVLTAIAPATTSAVVPGT